MGVDYAERGRIKAYAAESLLPRVQRAGNEEESRPPTVVRVSGCSAFPGHNAILSALEHHGRWPYAARHLGG